MEKKYFRSLVVLLTGLSCLASCIKDEEPGKECDIESAWVEGDEYKQYFTDVNQMRHDNISTAEATITFTVRSTYSMPRQMPVFFSLTEGATIEPANGSMQDFTAGPVTYTVTSADGQWKREYRVAFQEASLPTFKYSFEHVEEKTTSGGSTYDEFYELDGKGDKSYIWASGNAGAALTLIGQEHDAFPTSSVADGYMGKCLCLKTISAGPLGEWLQKPIAAGNLFLGKFLVENVLTGTLKTTRFGVPMDRKPVRVTGYYKYRPGEKFTDKDMKEVPGKTDQPHIYAVFYRNEDENGQEVFLYGDDVLSSPQIVKKAQVASLPPTDEWTRFEMFFEGDDADDAMVANNEYNMTLVFSSSKDGAQFEGAIGSVLYVDEVEVSFEK